MVEEACKLKTKRKAKTLIKMRESRFRTNTEVLTENTKTSKRLRKPKTQKGN